MDLEAKSDLADDLQTACIPTRSGFEGEAAYCRNYTGSNRRIAEHVEAVCDGIGRVCESEETSVYKNAVLRRC